MYIHFSSGECQFGMTVFDFFVWVVLYLEYLDF